MSKTHEELLEYVSVIPPGAWDEALRIYRHTGGDLITIAYIRGLADALRLDFKTVLDAVFVAVREEEEYWG